MQHIVRKKETVQQMQVTHGFQHRLSRLERHPRLVVIADAQRLTPVDDAFEGSAPLRPIAARQQVQEGGLAAGVASHDPYPFITLKVIGEV